MEFSLGKQERLKSKKLIEKLYKEGKSLKLFPFRMVYLQSNHTSNFPTQVGFSVPKRNFKNAVERNQIKRLLRESYRLQKSIIYNSVDKPYIFMISYLAKDELKFVEIYPKMEKLLTLFISELKSKSNEN